MIRYLIIGICFVLYGQQVFAQDITYAIDTEASDMKISGTSNLHDWQADVNTIYGRVVVKRALMRGNASADAIEDVFIRITVEDIRSDNNQLTKNMHKALNAEKQKYITFQLADAEVESASDNFQIAAEGNLKVAGTTRTVELENVNARFSEDRSKLYLSGSKTLNMTDFNIEPPTALLGTLKTDEMVTVTFELVATKQEVDD